MFWTRIGIALRLGMMVALVAGLSGEATAADRSVVSSALTRVAGASDPDATGRIRVRSDASRDRHEIEVEAHNIDVSIEHWLYIADDLGILQFIDALEVDGVDDVRFRVRTRDGDALPFGATLPSDLAGHRVLIRQVTGIGELDLLEGVMPGLLQGNGGRARVDLDPTGLAPARSRARVKLRSRPSKGDERFEVPAKRLDLGAGQDYRLFLEDPANLGTLVDVGALMRRATSMEARFRRRTKDGEALPFGVASVADLEGLAVEIIDAAADPDEVYFEGTVPALR